MASKDLMNAMQLGVFFEQHLLNCFLDSGEAIKYKPTFTPLHAKLVEQIQPLEIEAREQGAKVKKYYDIMRNDSISASSIMENTTTNWDSTYPEKEKARYEEYAKMSANEAFLAIAEDVKSGKMYPISSIGLINDRPGLDKFESLREKELPPELISKPRTVEDVRRFEKLAQAYRAGRTDVKQGLIPNLLDTDQVSRFFPEL